jgi:hypothetical protein
VVSASRESLPRKKSTATATSMEALYRWANCADSHWQDRRYAKSLRVKCRLLLDTSSPTDSGTDCPGNRCAQESVPQAATVDSARF